MNEIELLEMQMRDIFKPSLAHVLFLANPTEYEKWQGNHCRQSAMIGAYVLSRLAPQYKWRVFDGLLVCSNGEIDEEHYFDIKEDGVVAE